MCRLDDRVTASVQQRLLLSSVRSPEEEYDVLGTIAERTDDFVGEALPALALVTGRLMSAHRQRGVEEQHALASPRSKISGGVWRDPEVGVEFLEDVAE